MEILHVLDNLDPARGGPQIVVPSLAAAQAALGCRVRILSYWPASADAQIAERLGEIPSSASVEIVRLRRRSLLEQLLVLEARQNLRRLISPQTFVHLHGVWEPLLWAAAGIAQDQGAAYAVRLCGILQPGQMNRYRIAKSIAFLLGARRMLREAAFIHALTEAEARFARKYTGNAPIEVIPNGVFTAKYTIPPAAGAFYQKHPELCEHPYILFLSRLHYHKGVMCLIQAFAHVASQLPHVHLVLAGPDGGEKGRAEKEVARAGLSDRVHIIGPIYAEEKAAAFRDAVCFCLPSRSEGMSNAILEALTWGTPVVLSEECYWPEIVAAGAAESVVRNPKAIATALVRILSDEQRRKRMSTAARTLVMEKYDWAVIARRTLQLYETAANRVEKRA